MASFRLVIGARGVGLLCDLVESIGEFVGEAVGERLAELRSNRTGEGNTGIVKIYMGWPRRTTPWLNQRSNLERVLDAEFKSLGRLPNNTAWPNVSGLVAMARLVWQLVPVVIARWSCKLV